MIRYKASRSAQNQLPQVLCRRRQEALKGSVSSAPAEQWIWKSVLSSSFITGIVGFLVHSYGLLYREGYLFAFGVKLEAFPISVQESFDYAYRSFFGHNSDSIARMSDMSLVALASVFIALLSAAMYLIISVIDKLMERRKKKGSQKRFSHFTVAMIFGLVIGAMYWVAWIVLFGGFFGPVSGFQDGRADGEVERLRYLNADVRGRIMSRACWNVSEGQHRFDCSIVVAMGKEDFAVYHELHCHQGALTLVPRSDAIIDEVTDASDQRPTPCTKAK